MCLSRRHRKVTAVADQRCPSVTGCPRVAIRGLTHPRNLPPHPPGVIMQSITHHPTVVIMQSITG